MSELINFLNKLFNNDTRLYLAISFFSVVFYTAKKVYPLIMMSSIETAFVSSGTRLIKKVLDFLLILLMFQILLTGASYALPFYKTPPIVSVLLFMLSLILFLTFIIMDTFLLILNGLKFRQTGKLTQLLFSAKALKIYRLMILLFYFSSIYIISNIISSFFQNEFNIYHFSLVFGVSYLLLIFITYFSRFFLIEFKVIPKDYTVKYQVKYIDPLANSVINNAFLLTKLQKSILVFGNKPTEAESDTLYLYDNNKNQVLLLKRR